MNTQDWSPLGWIGWISLQSKGLFKSLIQHHSSQASILRCSAFFIVQLYRVCLDSPFWMSSSPKKIRAPWRNSWCQSWNLASPRYRKYLAVTESKEEFKQWGRKVKYRGSFNGHNPLGNSNDNPLQYSCLENLMDRGGWWATVHSVAESDTTEWLTLQWIPLGKPGTIWAS